MKIKAIIFSLLAVITFSNIVYAAMVNLKDGRSFEGDIVSQDSHTIVLDIAGITMKLPTELVSTIDMSTDINNTKSEANPTTMPEKANHFSSSATIESGTALTIRMSQQVNSRENKTGTRFTAVLEANLMAGNILVAKKETQVYGVLTNVKKAGRIAGSASLTLALTEISIDGTMHKIATQPLSSTGNNTARKSVGQTARAAAIGGLIDGSDGAKTGAKVGVGAAILTRGNDIQIPQGTLLDFVLRTPLHL